MDGKTHIMFERERERLKMKQPPYPILLRRRIDNEDGHYRHVTIGMPRGAGKGMRPRTSTCRDWRPQNRHTQYFVFDNIRKVLI